jgi:hypothetical protein
MKTKRILAAALLGAFGLVPLGPAVSSAQTSSERVRAAKELFFDKKYDEARRAWQAVADGGKGAEAENASYWVARCSENLGELARAFGEYGRYLARPPADRAQAEEARTARVGLAARLYKAGTRQHLPALTTGLEDPSKTVRYYAALQLAGLGAEVGRPAIPVLKRIVADEKDDDLVERAKLALLRLEPRALVAPAPGPSSPRSAAPRAASFIRVRVYGRGKSQPEVAINLPVALAELVFKSLPDEARQNLRLKGIDADNFWDKLKKLGPTEIIDIQGDDGEKVQIWME